MARYKEFNSNRVLEKCIVLFWGKGFGSSAVSEIVKETGVNRYSLYDEFENKEGILHSSLKLYDKRYSEDRIQILSGEGTISEILMKFYLSFHREDGIHPPGDYIITVSTELGDTDPAVKEYLKEYIDKIKVSLSEFLVRKNFSQKKDFYVDQLIGLFCTSMSFSLIHSYDDRVRFIKNGINVIFKKSADYAANSI